MTWSTLGRGHDKTISVLIDPGRGTKEHDQYFRMHQRFLSSFCLFVPPAVRIKALGLTWDSSCSCWNELPIFISCKPKICCYSELESAGLWPAQGRTDSKYTDNCSDTGAFIMRNVVIVALPLTEQCGAAKSCGLQPPYSYLSHFQASTLLEVTIMCFEGEILHHECSRNTFPHRCCFHSI